MTRPDDIPQRGIAGFTFSREERRLPVVQRLLAALHDEKELLRDHLERPSTIEQTTLRRGEVQAVKKILARAVEVGPESWQSEAQSPESAFPPPAVTGLPEGY